jgi:hypothetical protein
VQHLAHSSHFAAAPRLVLRARSCAGPVACMNEVFMSHSHVIIPIAFELTDQGQVALQDRIVSIDHPFFENKLVTMSSQDLDNLMASGSGTSVFLRIEPKQ